MYWLERFGEEAREEFCSYLLGKPVEFEALPPSRLVAVDTGGKVRLLTVPPGEFALLQPLHSIMYDHLSRKKWLLRGDAKAARFGDFCRVPGEVFVSGDYESATDSLNQVVQKEILQAVLDRAVHVPYGIRGLAMNSLSSKLTDFTDREPGETVQVSNGQMMGFPLSFPLLCLVNYLAFIFVVGRDAPVRVNGDDIVFRAKRAVAQQWIDNVGKSGLKLSVGKTMVDRTFFTLNSTLFKASGFKVKMVPFVRSKALFGKDDSLCSVPGRFKSAFPGFTGSSAFLLRACFLRQNVGYITASRRSLNRGLGMKVRPELLKVSRLWTRECSLLSLPVEKPPPAPRSMWEKRPEGFELARKECPHRYTKEEKDDLVTAVVNAAWCPPGDSDYRMEYLGGASVPPLNTSKFSRLAGISKREARELISSRNEEIFSQYSSRRVRLHPYWRKKMSSTASDVDEQFNDVPKLRLGRGYLIDCRGKEPRFLSKPIAGCPVKLFRRGIGIGPPPSF